MYTHIYRTFTFIQSSSMIAPHDTLNTTLTYAAKSQKELILQNILELHQFF